MRVGVQVSVTPDGDGNSVELVGELAALLRLSGNKNAATLAGAADSGVLVAGTGFEPVTFRL
jgi:hypothetical protein